MKKKGSFTIEAAIIVPLLFFVVLLMMHISFFLYNREALTVIASRAVLKGVQMEQEGKAAIEHEVDSFLKEEMETRLIFTTSTEKHVEVTGIKVKVTLKLTQAMPFKELDCQITKEMSRQHPAYFIWEKERLKKAK